MIFTLTHKNFKAYVCLSTKVKTGGRIFMKMTKRILATATAALTVTAALAGCTGGTSSTTSTAAPSQADANKVYNIGICQLVQHEALDAATKGFKDTLTENSAQTRLSLTSRTHRAIRLLALQSVTSLFLQIMTLFSVTVLRLFRLHTRQHRLFLFSVLRLQTTAQLLIWQSGQAFRV